MSNTYQTPDITDLKSATETLYKKNFELSVKNQTLSVLRKLYNITLSQVETNQLAQQIVDTITTELGFSASMICLVDPNSNSLKPIAISHLEKMNPILSILRKNLSEIAIPLNFSNNLNVNCLLSHTRQTTTNFLDILDPIVTQEDADKIENLAGVKTIVIYPLTVADRDIGTLCIGLPNKVDDLSLSEKETLEQLIDLVAIAIDRAQLYENLKTANDKLIKLDKIKDEFVYLASHELRTPLTAIKSYVWLVLNGKAEPVGEKTSHYLNIAFNSTERLIHLVNEMLDLSRIESGKTQLKPTQFDFAELLTDLAQEFSAKAQQYGLILETKCDSSPLSVTADRDKIMQVLENLVGNSMKFTPQGGRISVSASVDGTKLKVGVSDTGKGISAEDLPRLFTKFGKLDNNLTTLPESGTGLGLYLTKQFVELHHGTISVSSTPGQGTTFTFTLPFT